MQSIRRVLLLCGLVSLGTALVPNPSSGVERQQKAIGQTKSKAAQSAQDIFFSPTYEAEKAWGEPAVNFHDGQYFMIYDYFPHPLPFCLATSRDGVYWKDVGPVFERDEDSKDIECAYVHRLQQDGPYVMQYAFRKQPYPSFRMRFAVSEDLVRWKKLGAASNFLPDPRWYNEGRWDTIVPCPKGDGTHYGVWDGVPKKGSGFGFGTTTDGIHWDVRPPVRVMVPQKAAGCAGELGGFFKFGDRYFLLFSRMQALGRDEFVVSSGRPEGPYHITPRNHFRAEAPFIYTRYYRLPGGVFGSEMLWMHRDGKRSYHFPLLKKVVCDDQSLWLKWWAANDKLKVQDVALSPPQKTDDASGHRRFAVPELVDFSKGTVIEGKIRLGSKEVLPRNLARDATVTATSVWQDINQAGGFDARHAVDDDPATCWLADIALGQEVQLRLDLGAVRLIGHVRVEGRIIKQMEASMDGEAWTVVPPTPDYRPEAGDCLGNKSAQICSYYDGLSIRARYVRIVVKQGGITDVGIYETPCQTAGRDGSVLAGLVLQRAGDKDYAILVGPDSTVMLGPIDKDGSHFRYGLHRNIDVDFGDEAEFRLVLREDMGEFYVNDYQISLINLAGPNRLTGRIGFVGSSKACPVRDLKAWHANPDADG